MLSIIVHVDLHPERGLQAVDKGRDGAIPLTSHRARLPIDEELNRDLRPILVGHGFVTQELYRGMRREVGGGKRLPHVAWADLSAGVLGDGLDGFGEFNL